MGKQQVDVPLLGSIKCVLVKAVIATQRLNKWLPTHGTLQYREHTQFDYLPNISSSVIITIDAERRAVAARQRWRAPLRLARAVATRPVCCLCLFYCCPRSCRLLASVFRALGALIRRPAFARSALRRPPAFPRRALWRPDPSASLRSIRPVLASSLLLTRRVGASMLSASLRCYSLCGPPRGPLRSRRPAFTGAPPT